jgi:hypothetical protein
MYNLILQTAVTMARSMAMMMAKKKHDKHDKDNDHDNECNYDKDGKYDRNGNYDKDGNGAGLMTTMSIIMVRVQQRL